MGFEAREAILEVLDGPSPTEAEVFVVAYDLNEPESCRAPRRSSATG